MSGFYGIDGNREVIRVHVKKFDGFMQPETKKFSIDPQITSFEMLQNILAKAFDIKSDLLISYLSHERSQDVYLAMLSDWDMDAAFQNASDPCLRLKVELKPFDENLEDWDIIAPVEIPTYRMHFLEKGRFLGNLTGTISDHVGRTVSTMQRVMGIKSEDEQQYRPLKAPMTDMEFRNYLDSDGHMVKPEEFRLSIYQGGVEPALRRVVWRHLLNIYPEDMSGRERFDYMKRKEKEYFDLRDNWKELFNNRAVSEEAKQVATLVKKDVLRTDRTHKFYSGGDDSKNLLSLYNLLVTYALTHPEVSYCQGMSDIASPLLVVQKEEAQAYLCFCGLMERLTSNFMFNGEAITTKLQHLSNLVHIYDPVFHMYLKEHDAGDLFFCYRWLLLEMKREFPFEDALYMLEVMWSTLPPSPPSGGLELSDPDYSPALLMTSLSPHSPTVAIKRTQYANLLLKRRRLTSYKDSSGTKSTPQASTNASSGDEELTSPTNTVTVTVDNLTNEKSEQTVKADTPDSDKLDEVDGIDPSSLLKNCFQETDSAVSARIESPCSSHETGSTFNITSSSPEGSSVDSSPVDSVGNVSSDASKDTSCSSHYTTLSSISQSQSVERFPSLICASVEEVSGDIDENENENSVTMWSDGSTQVIEMNGDSKQDQLTENQTAVCNSDVDDQESQFHLSLGENDIKTLNKKKSVPQIKGSFFSGMKKILSSPKRRPGQAQPVLSGSKSFVNQSEKHKVDVANGGKSKESKSGKTGSSSEDSPDYEHTLFDRRMATSLTLDTRTFDGDSGNCSLSSSTNSSEVKNNSRQVRNMCMMKNKANLLEKNGINVDGVQNSRYVAKSGSVDGLGKIPVLKPRLSSALDLDTDFCDNHFDYPGSETSRSDEAKEASTREEETLSECMEVLEVAELDVARFNLLPPPDEFGYGNPFLMFLCLTVLVQHRDFIMKANMEYDELAMSFDKMVRKHKVNKVLHQTRYLYTEYIRIQQKLVAEKTESNFSV